MPLFKDEAIVLLKRPFGESDRIVHLFTLKTGKIAAIAKGGGKSQKRFANTLEPFNHIRVEYFEKQMRGMVRIDNADIMETNAGIETSLKRACAAGFFTEFLDRLTKERERHDALFYLLKEILSAVKGRELSYTGILHYQLRMLETLGYLPNLAHCVYCGKDIPEKEKIYFSRERGGVLCGNCSSYLPYRTYSHGVISVISTMGKEAPIPAELPARRELTDLIEGFVAFHLEVECKSYRILKGIMHE
jgi:DNA repair protein RecO (recombination protein O)